MYPDHSDWIPLREAARVLGVCEATVRRMRARGEVTTRKIGRGAPHYSRRELVEMVERAVIARKMAPA